jgi:aryl-alcohol dehydrogenase-like predicted oxidoreductase
VERVLMLSEKIGRRKFLKNMSLALGGSLASQFLGNLILTHAEKKPTLEYRTLGKTGLKVTAVSMGVMNCSDPAVLHRAFDLGINFYDTAPSYMRGTNEEMVGRVFQGKRDKVFIQTKVHAHDEKRMRASVERSLRRLKTDYIDVLVWHGHSSPEEVSDLGLHEFMVKMRKEGKARFTGFSAHSNMASLLIEAAKSNLHDVALVSYNFTHSKKLKEAVALAAKSGIGIVAMKTQSGGYKKEKMGGLNPHQAALKYILMDQNVSAAVPGVTTIEQIEECAAVMGTSFSKGDLDALKQYQSFLQGKICTMCGGCIGECPYGVSQGDLLRAVMYHDGYGNDSLVKESFQTITKQDIQHCSECTSCSVICRRGLNIQAQMQLAQKLLVRSLESIVQG